MSDFVSWEMPSEYLMNARIQAFGEASNLINYRFDRDNGLVPQLSHARTYAKKWEQMREKAIGLLFWGQPGNGKTFAAACIANALMERQGREVPRVKMTTLGTVLNRLPALSPQDKQYYLEGLNGSDLLILDDFGMERRTDYAREQIFSLIDSRYLSSRPLIVTTNLSLEQLKSPADMAEKRVYDRILEMCVPVCFDGESLRAQKGREKMQLFRELISA